MQKGEGFLTLISNGSEAKFLYKLEDLDYRGGISPVPTVSVRISTPDGSVRGDVAIGETMAKAVFNSIDRCFLEGKTWEVSYSTFAVVQEMVRATVVLREGKTPTYHPPRGEAVDVDPYVALAKAYLRVISACLMRSKQKEKVEEAV